MALELAEGPLTRVSRRSCARRAAVEVRFEWSAAEAARTFARRRGRISPALMLGRPRLATSRSASAAMRGCCSSAVPYFTRDALIDLLLDLRLPPRLLRRGRAAARRARRSKRRSIGAAPSCTRALEEIAAAAAGWFAQARDVRRLLDDPRARGARRGRAGDAGASRARARCARFLRSLSPDWLRQVPRYLRGGGAPLAARASRAAPSRAQILARARRTWASRSASASGA